MLKQIFGSKNERELRGLWPLVQEVNALEAETQKLSNEALQAKTGEFKQRLEQGESLDALLPEAFSVVREASVRILGMRHFDVQLLGGMVLHQGRIAEMKTGEGKTLCATLPVYLNALSGKGVHLVTVNDYLARRDAQWMGEIYSFLGLSTGVVLGGIEYADRKAAYRADITYGQNNEFGFDYLRDNMKLEAEEMVQKSHNFAIVDEVDSILIDEARTPLIISGPSESPTETYELADSLVRKLKKEEDYTVELKTKNTLLTDEGVAHCEKLLGVENLYDPRNIELVHHITQGLKAHATMKRDVDYVVRDNQVIIVDEFTGRLMAGRRWSDGLHQAVECKERVPVANESQTFATITFQNYFRMYQKLAGMTGTADTEAVEFQKIYGLDVVVVPTNKPMARRDYRDVVFASERGKYSAVCDEIEELHEKGQPVLVGTASIARSEMFSAELQKRKIPHHVLNAKQHEREAEIVAQAGRLGAVTISTNMAGRGTDIVLGGNPEFLAADEMQEKNLEEAGYPEILKKYKDLCAEEKQQVLDVGGLHILGTERHESRRIDNQLRGRSGRQGDPGSSRFYVSLEDDLMKRFGGERVQALMSRVGMQDDDAIESALITRTIENAQKKVEGYHFDVRKHLLEYDDVLNKQREIIYKERAQVLQSKDGSGVETAVEEMVPDIVEDIILIRASEKAPPSDWDIQGMFGEFNRLFRTNLDGKEFLERQEDAEKEIAQELFDSFQEIAREQYEKQKSIFGPEQLTELERIVYLQAIDHFWKEHLTNIDHLKEGIGLRGYGQKNPLQEYQREAFELFQSMMLAIKSAVIQHVFSAEALSREELEAIQAEEREQQRRREEAAKTIHEDISDGSSSGDSADGLNRRQRRRQQTQSSPPPQEAWAGSSEPSGAKQKKAAKRKKNKAAKKARRKGR